MSWAKVLESAGLTAQAELLYDLHEMVLAEGATKTGLLSVLAVLADELICQSRGRGR